MIKINYCDTLVTGADVSVKRTGHTLECFYVSVYYIYIEIELYSLFVLFCFTFCVAIYCIPISS